MKFTILPVAHGFKLPIYSILGNFSIAKFHKNDDFNNSANDPRGQHKRCGMAILTQNLILRLSKICENKAMRKFPSIMVPNSNIKENVKQNSCQNFIQHYLKWNNNSTIVTKSGRQPKKVKIHVHILIWLQNKRFAIR